MCAAIQKFKKYNATYFFTVAGVALCYFIIARLGLTLASIHPSATAVWPPTGIALAAIFIFGPRMWPGIFLGAFFINLFTYGNTITSLGIALGNTLEALTGVYLVSRFAHGTSAFKRHQDVFKFFIFAGFVAPAVSATIGVTSLAFEGFANWSAYGAIWLTWLLGDFGGAIIIAPFILSLSALWSIRDKTYPPNLYFIFTAAVTLCTGLIIFDLPWITPGYPIAFLTLPLLVWAASRASQFEISLSVLILAGTALIGTINGLGPFGTRPANEGLLLLQAFFGTISLTAFALGAFQNEITQEKEESQTFREAVENTYNHISITDVDGKILYVNKAAERITGFTKAEVLGKKAGSKELWGGLMDTTFYQKLWRTIKEEKRPFISECTNKRKNGEFYQVEMTLSPILDAHNNIKFFIEIERDITKEKQIEQARMDFLSLASHQLRTPLSGVKWVIEALLANTLGPTTKEQKEHLSHIRQVNEHMIKLVADMLSVLRIESGGSLVAKKSISIESLCSNVLLMMQGTAQKKNITIRDNFHNSNMFVETDPELTEQILQSLLSNAIEYSPPKTEVIINAQQNENETIFSIHDSGIGIPEKEQTRIFERFFRATNAQAAKPDGSGLGLYIANMLAKKINASLSFTSEPNKGSIFYLHIPHIKP